MKRPKSSATSRARLTFLGALVSSIPACIGAHTVEEKIAERWQWDGGVEASRLLSRLDEAKGPRRVAAAVGVTGFGLRGKALPDGKLWDFKAPVDVLPTIVSSVVLFTGEGMLHALDVRNGRPLFSVPVGGRRLEGAGFDGEYFVLLLVDEDDARQDQIKIVSQTGKSVFDFSVDARLGTPAAVNGVALVPYGGQYVAGFDIESHKWLGRLLYRDALHSVTANETGVILWGRGATMLGPNLTSSPESTSLPLALEEFPGSPLWPIDGSKPRPPRANPINVLAHPYVREGTLRFAQDTYVTTYYEVILGEEVGTHDLLWVNTVPRAIAGGAISKTHASLCLDDGSIVNLDLKNGESSRQGSLEARLKACVVSATDTETDKTRRANLRQQIIDAVTQTGPEMAKVQTLLLDRLARLPGEQTTAALLTIAQDPLISSELAKHAGNLLATQKNGGAQMVRALNEFANARQSRLKRAADQINAPQDIAPESQDNAPESQDDTPASQDISPPPDSDAWQEESAKSPNEKEQEPGARPDREEREALEEQVSLQANSRATRRPPPVAAIAKALLVLETEGAAAALIRYLDDPALSAREIKTVMNTVYELGDQNETAAVHQFVLTYKNTGGEDALLDALAQGVEFLLNHLDPERQKGIKDEINESLTHPDLKKRARSIKIRRNAENSVDDAQRATPDEADTPALETNP